MKKTLAFVLALVFLFVLSGAVTTFVGNRANNHHSPVEVNAKTETSGQNNGTLNLNLHNNSDDTKRKNDLLVYGATITEWQSNNNGILPADAAEATQAVKSDPSFKLPLEPSTNAAYTLVDGQPTVGQIQYKAGYACTSTMELSVSTSVNAAALRTLLSGNKLYCSNL